MYRVELSPEADPEAEETTAAKSAEDRDPDPTLDAAAAEAETATEAEDTRRDLTLGASAEEATLTPATGKDLPLREEAPLPTEGVTLLLLQKRSEEDNRIENISSINYDKDNRT